ncbi:D-Ala-D-Ala carboxypeptidase family metallohydrolase [Moraxella sp. VT-16-12]|uniref:D-Ala-D-Ala carboxypeptidase family metallohydrolase n=1 Tax=Moraxella sp. VT-16-12 TaxID=2014877 RepID=UPI002107856B|nr:D-Ala-D-Ala carboxypeptidase family metallohydrolase [Moraxella sp. VT-16-12]
MIKNSSVIIRVSLLSVLLFGGQAQAGIFSWLFDKDKENQPSQTTDDRRVIVRTVGNVGEDHSDHSHDIERNVGTRVDYEMWLNQSNYYRQSAEAYEDFLIKQLGKENVPPMHELLTTARSWKKCGAEPYQVPPSELWHQMVPTIRLYNDLKKSGILPAHTQIRSVYRSPELNRCAGGAPASKHITNGAMDIWVPNYQVGSWQLSAVQDKLCQYWIDNGENRQFGLGIYATGAIHLDTQGYRKWGGQFTQSNSPCRYVLPKKEVLYIDGQGWAE